MRNLRCYKKVQISASQDFENLDLSHFRNLNYSEDGHNTHYRGWLILENLFGEFLQMLNVSANLWLRSILYCKVCKHQIYLGTTLITVTSMTLPRHMSYVSSALELSTGVRKISQNSECLKNPYFPSFKIFVDKCPKMRSNYHILTPF